MLSSHLENALNELKGIAAISDALEIINVLEPVERNQPLLVNISLSLTGVPRTPDGIPLRQREQFVVCIPPGYPFEYPRVWVSHSKWADWPHVQWTNLLCIYQSPDTDWDPVDGMFGFIDRLYLWIQRAAANQLDLTGAPVHPPISYIKDSSVPLVIPCADTPPVGDTPWIGLTRIDNKSEERIDITGWQEINDVSLAKEVAASVLLPRPAVFEFPSKMKDLLDILNDQGVSRETLFETLGRAAIINGEGTRLVVLIGTPTRGIRGSGVSQQHLMAWLLESPVSDGLKLTLEEYLQNLDMREAFLRLENAIIDWFESADIVWCPVREARPEVTIRRDHDSPMAWFRGKTVVVWGCGAIGGQVAEAIARAGVKKLILWDKGVVTPGVLVRQLFDDSDIGKNKAIATRDRLLRAFPNLSIESFAENVIGTSNWHQGAHLAINTTASWPVTQWLQISQRNTPSAKTTLASMMLGHKAHRALLYISEGVHTGGIVDLTRKTKIGVLEQGQLGHFIEDFWPEQSHITFQPEPGCSDPTFIGSHAEIMGLVGAMLTTLSHEVGHKSSRKGSSHLFSSVGVEISDQEIKEYSFHFPPDLYLQESIENYQVRVAPQALKAIRGWIRKSENRVGRDVETGGHVFGERNDLAKIIWITEVSGPPPDSIASPRGFHCGFSGVSELSKKKSQLSRGAVRFVGMWHTHPSGSSKPSITDYNTMREIVSDNELSCPKSLLMVISTTRQRAFEITGALFSRGAVPDFDALSFAMKRTIIPLDYLQFLIDGQESNEY